MTKQMIYHAEHSWKNLFMDEMSYDIQFLTERGDNGRGSRYHQGDSPILFKGYISVFVNPTTKTSA